MKRVQTKWRRLSPKLKELTQDSVTQPAMALSIQQILDRYTTGMPVPDMSKRTFFDGDLMLPEPHLMDINEAEEYRERLSDYVDHLTAELEQRRFDKEFPDNETNNEAPSNP